MPYKLSKVPAGEKISISGGKLQVPNQPIVPYIEGDGTGVDIWRASVRVMDAAVAKGNIVAKRRFDSLKQYSIRFWPMPI